MHSFPLESATPNYFWAKPNAAQNAFPDNWISLTPHQWNYNALFHLESNILELPEISSCSSSCPRYDAELLLLLHQVHTKQICSFCNEQHSSLISSWLRNYVGDFHAIIKHNDFTKSEFAVMKKYW